jgi:hypothetical protein
MAASQDFAVEVLRPDDLLVLRFEFVNLRLELEGGARIERADPTAESYLLVVLPPQHINEQAFLKVDPPGEDEPLKAPPVRSVIAGPSRLAFRLPDDMPALPFTLDSLLKWSALEPSVAANALPAEPSAEERAACPRPEPPLLTETAVELPYRLVLSPSRTAAWEHATSAQARDGRVELWHTRLGATGRAGMVDQANRKGRAIRAVWTPDRSDPVGAAWPASEPPRQPLSPKNRITIVGLSSDFGLAVEPSGFYDPAAIDVRRLMLTALGGYLDIQGHWPQPQPREPEAGAMLAPIDRSGLGLVAGRSRAADMVLAQSFDHVLTDVSAAEPSSLKKVVDFTLPISAFLPTPPGVTGEWGWIHRAQAGRDEFVEFDTPGILFPLGHRATLVKITERRFEVGPLGKVGAYLRQRLFITVTQPVRDYLASAAAFPRKGRELPFASIRFATLVTPNLSNVDENDPSFPMLGSNPYAFDIIGVDQEGRAVPASMPLVFVPFKFDVAPATSIAKATPVYDAHPDWHSARVAQKDVAFAPIGWEKPGSTSALCSAIRFGVAVDHADNVPRGEAPVLPKMVNATVNLPALAPLAGPAAAQSQTTIVLADQYLGHGIGGGGNPAHLFATLQTPIAAGMAPDRAGGIASPSFAVQGLSRALGPIADVAQMGAGTFSPDGFLPSAKLFGALDLKDLIVGIEGDLRADAVVPLGLRDLSFDELVAELAKPEVKIPVPVLGTHRVIGPDDQLSVETLYVWKPAIEGFDAGLLKLELDDAAQFALSVYHRQPVGGGNPQSRVDGRLTNFALEFGGVVRVRFGAFAFASVNGAKMDVNISNLEVEFHGALEFVQTIQSILPKDGFMDPPYLTVLPTGVTAGFTLGVPALGVGVVSIENLALDAGVSLPFTGDPSGVRFAISSREHPFLVTVSLFGGGGFFAFSVNTAGPPAVEAAIEFGGNFSLDIGVASGNVHVMAGIYFAMLGSQVKLSGYVRLGGSVEVLGLVSISVEFYLALNYDDGKAYGEATLTVSVDILGFSESVALHVERKFAGAAGDPTFAELVDPGAWHDYCVAFA